MYYASEEGTASELQWYFINLKARYLFKITKHYDTLVHVIDINKNLQSIIYSFSNVNANLKYIGSQRVN